MRVLFICTGNYYRSRFAEAIFNYTATTRKVDMSAFSRGLGIYGVNINSIEKYGELSNFTRDMLEQLKIPASFTGERRVALKEEDLVAADLVIAMDRDEHFPMMEKDFPVWKDRIVYWNFKDLGKKSLPKDVLPRIKVSTEVLFERLLEEKEAV